MSHLFISLEHQSEGGYLLSLGAEQRLELQDLLHAAIFVLVQQRGQFPGCSSLSRQLQRPVYCPLEVLHLGEERREAEVGGEDKSSQEERKEKRHCTDTNNKILSYLVSDDSVEVVDIHGLPA